MKASAETIWQVPAYLPYVQPPLTAKALVEAEKKIGYKLPLELVALLKKQNGGYIRFSLSDVPHRCIAGIGPNYPSLIDFDWEEDQENVSFLLHGLVPFDGDGHWKLCLDYRKNTKKPQITYVDLECDSQRKIADSFSEYLDQLTLKFSDDNYVLEGMKNLEKVKLQLAELLAVKFDAPDTFAHGYPVHHARSKGRKNPQGIWISPNTVRHGFVRENEYEYEKLKDLMPEMADRFPGLPASSYLISATDGLQEKMLEACKQLGIDLRPLKGYL